MKIQTINSLCCPFCSGILEVNDISQENKHGIYFGLIGCNSCHLDFPVVAGVLILGGPSERISVWDEVSENLALNGVEIRTLCNLISENKNLDAFSLLLTPSGRGNLFFRPRLSSVTNRNVDNYPDVDRFSGENKIRVLLRIQWLVDKYARGLLQRSCRYRLAHFLLNHSQNLAATDVIKLFYGDYSQSEMVNYFTFRFGQPRHLAALEIASIIKERGGPILDLACGMGHLTHYFTWGEQHQRQVIGIERDYFRLYLAKNFMAPEADFICQWADRPLPFPAGSFDSIFCSDAFHYFLNKVGCLREMEQVLAPNGLIAITRLGNLEQKPNEGYELTVDGYSRLFNGIKHVFLGEEELIDSYLKKHKTNLQPKKITEEIRSQKWLSVVMSKEDSVFCDHGNFSEYPHSVGQLIKNPIYASATKTSFNNLTLNFEFPSEHFAFEDQRYQSYTPEQVSISEELLTSLEAGTRTSELEELIAQFVLVGVPKKFIPKQVVS
jgi:SAM-dependent methyltransferase/uncharacterized protein YbaR (Trm112 family)